MIILAKMSKYREWRYRNTGAEGTEKYLFSFSLAF